MIDEKFDAIVIGAGMAGNAAAYTMASRGLKVLQLERGEYPGSKNVQGGILYADMLEKIIPDFRDEAPLERHLIEQRFWLMTDKAAYRHALPLRRFQRGAPNRYTIIRSQFDRWFARQAQAKGAILLCETTAIELIRDAYGKVDGRAHRPLGRPDPRRCRRAGGRRQRPARHRARNCVRARAADHVALAVKEMHFLPAEDDRGALQPQGRRGRGDRGRRNHLRGHGRHGLHLHQQGKHFGRHRLPGFRFRGKPRPRRRNARQLQEASVGRAADRRLGGEGICRASHSGRRLQGDSATCSATAGWSAATPASSTTPSIAKAPTSP